MRPKREIVLPALSAAALSLAVPQAHAAPRAQTPAQVRHEIERLYQVGDAAAEDHDAGVALALLAPGFVVLDEYGNKATLAQITPAIRKMYEKDRTMTDTKTYSKTTITSFQVSGDHATVRWKGHQEAVSRKEYAVADVQDEATGKDEWVRTPAGWRMQRQRRLSFHRTARGGITPEAAQALQQVHQSRELLNQVIAGEQASDDQQQQIRIEQRQHDEQIQRQRHGH